MKTNRLITSIIIGCFFTTGLFAGRNSVSFNVMMTDSQSEKKVEKAIKSQKGVRSVKASAKKGTVAVEYEDAETNISTLTAAFKEAGYYASPIGENCALKKGGCLNNAPTTINTMK
jgi:copper chaperone CopZ